VPRNLALKITALRDSSLAGSGPLAAGRSDLDSDHTARGTSLALGTAAVVSFALADWAVFQSPEVFAHLDTLSSRLGPTARSWMLAGLLAAALAQNLVRASGPRSPSGYEVLAEWLHS